jgi:hypothetical protein
MADGFMVDAEQIRAHAATVDAVRERFAAVKAASSAISRDDAAYGMLCGWIGGVLEARHARQDELIAYVEENLRLAGVALRQTGAGYEQADDTAARRIRSAGTADASIAGASTAGTTSASTAGATSASTAGATSITGASTAGATSPAGASAASTGAV